MAEIAVHIVTHNSGATLGPCVRALQAQAGVLFSACLVDNASTDDTVAQARALGLPVICNSRNLGYAAAHNQALASTESRYVLTLNPDVWLDPDYLRTMRDALDRAPAAGSAAGCLLRVERLGETPHSVDGAGLYMRRNRRQGLRYEGYPISRRPLTPASIFGPDGAAAFYRRRMLKDVRVLGEVFDSDFFMHKEDVDLCWRAQLLGWSSLYVPGALAHHVRGFRPGRRRVVSAELRFYAARNRYLLMMKNELRPHFLRDLPAILPYDLGIALYILLREPELRGCFGAARNVRRRMLEKRCAIMNRRRVEWKELAQWFWD